MNTRRLLRLALGFSFSTVVVHAEPSVEAARATLREWVETRRLLSKEQADWQLEKSILAETRTLLENELERLAAALENVASATSTADEERASLTAEAEEYSASAIVIAEHVAKLEARVRTVLPTLPPPLLERIRPLTRRLPADPATTRLSLGERVQNIVGILSQAEKFNGTVTLTSETRVVEEGKEVEVRTLYWGLAMACYVDTSGRYAGFGHPGAEGWEWPRVEGAGRQIQDLLAVYEGTAEVRFVEIPARLR